MKNKPYTRPLAVSVFVALLLLVPGLATRTAHAATIQVTTTDQCGFSHCQSDDGKAGCSFGEAISAINQGGNIGECVNDGSAPFGVNDTIHLPAGGTLGFLFPDHWDERGPTALPAITRSVTIHGHGSVLVRESYSDDGEFESKSNMRFFMIDSQFGPDPETYSPFDGSEVLVFWDETTFDGGDPGCGSNNDIIEIAKRFDVALDVPSETRDAQYPNVSIYTPCHSGGAGYVRGSGTYVSFDRTTFKDNQVYLYHPYRSPLGGAVFIDGGAFGLANFSKSLFTGNRAPAGGAIYAGVSVQMAVTDSTFADNAAIVLSPWKDQAVAATADGKMGGAIFAEGPSLTVNHSAFLRNEAGIAGAIAVRGESANIQNTTFFDNEAEVFGGAVAVVPVPYSYRDLFGPDIDNAYTSGGFYDYALNALSRFGSPDMSAQHVTAVGNAAGGGPETMPALSAGGGIANLGSGQVSLKSLILTGNAVATGGSGPDCYGSFVSYGTNDLNWPIADGSCVVALAPGAAPDLAVDPVLKACHPDTATPGLASCDPDTASPLLEAALACPAEDQHHVARAPAKCTVGAIEVTKPEEPAVVAGVNCGNGQVEEGEECDEGEARNSDEANAACRTDCTAQRCGDDVVDREFGESCEPSLDPINCRSDCTIDLCFTVKEDAVRVGSGDLKLSDYLSKYGIDPSTGCSADPAVNQCQPLSSLGGPGGGNVDFTVPTTVCQTTAASGGCSLIR